MGLGSLFGWGIGNNLKNLKSIQRRIQFFVRIRDMNLNKNAFKMLTKDFDYPFPFRSSFLAIAGELRESFHAARNFLVTFLQLRPAKEMEMPAHKFLSETVSLSKNYSNG